MSFHGLTVFIGDIRACKSREAEEKRVNKELANIRKKFKDEPKLTAYDKKKYVWKLMYISLLGYEVDVGHIAAINLISSQKFSEKLVGYMAISVLLNENNELLRLIVNATRNDMLSQQPNIVALSLTSVANSCTKEMAETLATTVERLVLASDTLPLVKKKAAICLLRLYRKHPDIITSELWADRIWNLMEEKDIGVLTSIMSLVLGIVSKNPREYDTVPRAAKILTRLVLDRECRADYQYYGIPCPWLQVKVLRLLQYYPCPENEEIKKKMIGILQSILGRDETPKNQPKNNAAHAILFEAMNVVIAWDLDKALVNTIITILGRFISQTKAANTKYLTLHMMARIVSMGKHADAVKKYQPTIISALNDTDISIRRRALDLMFELCDRSNAQDIVTELLNYLTVADYGIQEELVLKIAILAERFATSYAWYVEVIMKLIARAGDFVSDDIWFRVVQIVTNNEDLQRYAAKTVFEGVQPASAHETAVRIGGYVLGEFGHLISSEEGCGGVEQFESLQQHWNQVSQTTKALLLSSYIKLVNVYDELRDRAIQVFEQHGDSIDAELQQRAIEYLAMSRSGGSLMHTVWEVMPNFPERESLLLKRLREKFEDEQSGSLVWKSPGATEFIPAVMPEGEEEAEEEEGPPVILTASSAVPAPTPAAPAVTSLIDVLDSETPSTSSQKPPPISTGIEELDQLMSGAPSKPAADGVGADLSSDALVATGTGDVLQSMSSAQGAVLSPQANPGMERQMKVWFKTLCAQNEGILYEDSNIQVGVKSEYHGSEGRMVLYYGNKAAAPMTTFRAHVPPTPALQIKMLALPPMVGPQQQVQQLLSVNCMQPFLEPPSLQLVYSYGEGRVNLALKLPIILSKFMEPLEHYIPAAEFFRRWRAIPAPGPLENQAVFQAGEPIEIPKVTRLLQLGIRLAVLHQIDPNASNIVAVGTFFSAMGEAVVLLRLETNSQAGMYRMTVRAGNAQVTSAVASILKHELGHDA
eukprot:TRINITY_DN16628_c0_g1_i1.p1 TRINITY_DN16628_c0_g1~~TRINITY_DN16628_c0_g1_i1.p1  ORF type:complete len:997 (-),score=234.02 TRINITY_DN16628_c0_g1_i1:53-3019(-)